MKLSTLEKHDNGNTWKVIKQLLENQNYIVDENIFSPDQFGVPQHRKRIFIVGINKKLNKKLWQRTQ